MSHALYGQRCATVEYERLLKSKNQKSESKAAFEEWMNAKLRMKKQAHTTQREQATVYTIPVVVHVVHNGEALGIGANITDAQIISQIDVLTEDFRRLNADAANTPGVFLPVAADVELEFALAQRDPEGLPTNGIVRVNGNRAEWELADNYELKSFSYWPAEDYLNIWVTNIGSSFLGYAQFPTTNLVAGLEDASNSRLTDGVVIDYKAFGSLDKYPPADLFTAYNLGRTTTHEVGHYFGLRHTWGDDSGSCSFSDYVDDTPNQGNSTSGCPDTNPTTCGSVDMIQNYMDYTDDACMNIFTLGQKDRMRIILDNSPRRSSLKTSKGALAPVVVSNDLGIRNITSPQTSTCSGVVTPAIEVRNYGNNTITSASVELQIDGTVQESPTFILNLAPLEIDTLTFSAIALTEGLNYNFQFQVTAVNGVADGNADNNLKSITAEIPASMTLPLLEKLNSVPIGQIPTSWRVGNPDDLITWETLSTNNGEPGNQSIHVPFYDYEVEGEYDTLFTPVFDLSTISLGLLSFDRAYAKYPGVDSEGLIIKLSTNCGSSWDYTLFEKYGNELATAPETSSKFSPAGADDWERECISLTDFSGMANLRVAFISRNGFGNNLYLDNISIDNSDQLSNIKDLAITELAKPSLVSCPQQLEPTVIVNNLGCTIVNDFSLNYNFDNGTPITATYTGASLPPGETLEVALATAFFTEGIHFYNVQLNDSNDKDPTNDQISGEFIINNERDIIPIKEDFEDFSNTQWTIANKDQGITWETQATNKGVSLFLDARNYNGTGQNEWLVSPVLDFSNTEEAVLQFDLAYSFNNDSKDGLTIQVSTDCGITYDDVVFSRFGEELNTGDFLNVPETESAWSTISVNLNDYLGEDDVRIAFISTNSNGNNIYIDNIQMFVTNPAVTGINEIYPNPSRGEFNITFDLADKETVTVTVYDVKGQFILNKTFNNTLNQTYTFRLQNSTQGIYLVKVVGDSFSYIRRIFYQP